MFSISGAGFHEKTNKIKKLLLCLKLISMIKCCVIPGKLLLHKRRKITVIFSISSASFHEKKKKQFITFMYLKLNSIVFESILLKCNTAQKKKNQSHFLVFFMFILSKKRLKYTGHRHNKI